MHAGPQVVGQGKDGHPQDREHGQGQERPGEALRALRSADRAATGTAGDEHGDVEPPDVDAELERVRRDDHLDTLVAQAGLDLSEAINDATDGKYARKLIEDWGMPDPAEYVFRTLGRDTGALVRRWLRQRACRQDP